MCNIYDMLERTHIKPKDGTSLVVQRLRLCSQCRGGTRSHMLQLRPSAAKERNIFRKPKGEEQGA